MQLRVGVYNIAGGKDTSHDHSGDHARLERLLAKIGRLDSDLLGLVEVRANPPGSRTNASELIAREARKAGYHSCFGAALSHDSLIGLPHTSAKAVEMYQGNMLLSRYPIARYHSFLISKFIPYAGSRDTEPRHLLVALVMLPGDVPLYIGVTHLHTMTDRNNPGAADVRRVQCERILAILKDLPASDTTPLLLVGDFNNNPYLASPHDREPEIQVLLRELTDLSQDSGPTRIRHVAPDQIHSVRIDRVFGNRLIRASEIHPDQDPFDPETGMFTHDGQNLSDHRPVLVTVDVARAA